MRHPDEDPLGLPGTMVIGVVGCSAAAFIFAALMKANLPATDAASHQTMAEFFLDPFVLTVLVPIAFITGLFVSPFVHLAIKGRHHLRSMAVIFSAVFAEILLITPFSARLALVLVIPVLVCAVLFTKYSHFTELQKMVKPL